MRWPWRGFANCEFDAALHGDRRRYWHCVHGSTSRSKSPRPTRIRGAIEICLGDYETGRRHLARAIRTGAHALPRSVTRQFLFFSCATAALGMSQADDLVDDVREALRRAESFGDISGIIDRTVRLRQSALLRAQNASHDEAIDMLQRAQANMQKHKVHHFRAGDHRCRSGDRCRPQRATGRSDR